MKGLGVKETLLQSEGSRKNSNANYLQERYGESLRFITNLRHSKEKTISESRKDNIQPVDVVKLVNIGNNMSGNVIDVIDVDDVINVIDDDAKPSSAYRSKRFNTTTPPRIVDDCEDEDSEDEL